MYLIDISDSYPESYWLDYDAKKFPDPLLLKCGKAVDITEFSNVYLNANPKVSIERVLKYDYLFSSGPDIVSEKLAKILTKHNKKPIQLIPVKIKHRECFSGGFYMINYLSTKKSFDMERCECTPVIRTMPDGPKKFTRIVLLNTNENNSIFRAEEDFFEIVVTDDLAKKIKDSSIKGIKLVKEKTRF